MLPAVSTAAPAPIVSVAQGQLSGKSQGSVTAYLGVPYAAAPIGANRWRPPQPARPWGGVRTGDTLGASCMQDRWPPFGPYTRAFVDVGPVSEDCLFLNVWSPVQKAGPLPVLVWIHGGGFVGGAGATPINDGARLAAKGAVVVTINYRLGVFGYLAHPGLTAEDPRHTSGNYGLEDQVAALKWVRDNIARFGGDPKNVTVAGESGGAVSVSSLLISPEAAGLFQRAVAVSGTAMGFAAPTLSQAEQYGVKLAQGLGADNVAALRAVPAEKILAGVIEPPPGPGGAPGFAFWPVADGSILPTDPNNAAAPLTTSATLLTGYNTDENSLVVATSQADFEKYARAWFGAQAPAIMALYPHGTDAEAIASIHLLARDRYMTALRLWTDARLSRGGPSLYRYLYDHPSPVADGPGFGAFHTAGVPYIFGTLDTADRPYGPVDRAISEQLQGYLINFLRRGDPNGPGLPVWSKADVTGGTVMEIGDHPGARAAVSSPARFEALKAFVANGGALRLF